MIFVGTLSQAEIERRQKGRQLKLGRTWVKYEDLTQVQREGWLANGKGHVVEATQYIADCPFCASIAVTTCHVMQDGNYKHFVVCANPDCGCSLTPDWNLPEAIKRWNRRAITLRAILSVK